MICASVYGMRTTVELDEDLVRELREIAHRQGSSLRESLNLALRRGLKQSGRTRQQSRYRCPSEAMGQTVAPSMNMDKALALAGAMEDAETMRELELRK